MDESCWCSGSSKLAEGNSHKKMWFLIWIYFVIADVGHRKGHLSSDLLKTATWQENH
jgi:hypothetical protein